MIILFENTMSNKIADGDQVKCPEIICSECGNVIPDGLKYKLMAIHYENGEDKFLYYCPVCVGLRDRFLGINYPMYKGVINQILSDMRENHIIERETQRQEQKKKQKNSDEWIDDWDHQETPKKKHKKRVVIDDEEFIRQWENKSNEELAKFFNVCYSSIGTKACELRKKGIDLKKKKGGNCKINNEEFIKLWDKHSVKELSKIFNSRKESIIFKAVYLRKKGIKLSKKYKTKDWTDIDKKIKFFWDTCNGREIAKKINISEAQLYRRVKELRKKGFCPIKYKLSQDDINFMIINWDKYNLKEWGKYFGVSSGTICNNVKKIRELNPKLCPKRKTLEEKAEEAVKMWKEKKAINIHGDFNIDVTVD